MSEYRVRSTRTRAGSLLRRAADAAVIAGFCLLLVFLLFKFALVPVSVQGDSVSELAKGELVLVDRVSKFVSDHTVGDIVRADLGGGYSFYRLAAMGGSSYQVRNGKAYLDGALIDESAYSAGWPQEAEFGVSVPEGYVLLLPDLREGDFSAEGCIIPYNSIFGEVRFRVSPLSRLAIFK